MFIISEDALSEWILKNNGILHTRKHNNLVHIHEYSNLIRIVCLTGQNSILSNFFQNILPTLNYKIVIVIIESDYYELKADYYNHPKIIRWFTWNKSILNDKVVALPIGINFDRQYEPLIKYLKHRTIDYKPTNDLLLVNFKPDTNGIRKKLYDYAKINWAEFSDIVSYLGHSEVLHKPSNTEGTIAIPITPDIYYPMLASYKFVLSPPGAGIDCHRTWEAVYLGVIPIVLSSTINELYDDLPILVVNSFEQINKSFLEEEYNKIQNRKRKNRYNMLKMNATYWYDLITQAIISPYNITNITCVKKHIVSLVTYANETFIRSKDRIIKEANEFGQFEKIYALNPDDIDDDFKLKHRHVLSYKRGGGYYLWKPYVIKKIYDQLNYGEFLVFLDAGCTIQKTGIELFNQYLDKIDSSDYSWIGMQMHHLLEKNWTFDKIFKLFDEQVESKIGNSGQFISGIIILCKDEHSEKIINEWYTIADTNDMLFTDNVNMIEQIPTFVENRHDQSILSMCLKKYGCISIKDDTSATEDIYDKNVYANSPFIATRLR